MHSSTKKSLSVSLVLLGAAGALNGCDDSSRQSDAQWRRADLYQSRYESRADCVRDWGDSNQACPQSAAHGSSGGVWYYGPRYYWDRSLGGPVAVSQSGLRSVSVRAPINASGPAGNGANRLVASNAVVRSWVTVPRGGFGESARSFGGFGEGGVGGESAGG